MGWYRVDVSPFGRVMYIETDSKQLNKGDFFEIRLDVVL